MFVLGRVRALGLETPTVFLLFEVVMPFFAYLTAEHFAVSRLLAVVAAALFMKFYPELAYHRVVSLRCGQRKRVGAYRIRD